MILLTYSSAVMMRMSPTGIVPVSVCLLVFLVAGACAGPGTTGSEKERPRVYLVQLRMTEDKAEAERALGAALEWWNQSASSGLPEPVGTEQGSPLDIAYRTPLYRVQLGPFASRDEAEAVLAAAQEAYPEAFVVPDRRSAEAASQ